MKNKYDIFTGVVLGLFVMVCIIIIGKTIQSCNSNINNSPDVIIQEQKDSIVTLNNKLDSLKVEFIKDSYEAKLLSDSDAVELFYELLKH